MKKLTAVLALLGLMACAKAEASIVTSTASTSGVTLAAKPSVGKLVLKGCILANGDASNAAYVQIFDVNTSKLMLSLAAETGKSVIIPSGAPANVAGPHGGGGFAALFGEKLYFTGPIIVVGSETSSAVNLTCGVDVE